MTKKSAGKRVREVTAANVHDVKRRLEELAEEARALTELMQDFAGSVSVDGGKRAMEGIHSLRRWLLGIRAEFQDIDLPVFGEAEPPIKPKKSKR